MGSATPLGDPMLRYLSAEDFVIETYRDGGTGALDKLGRLYGAKE